MNLLRELQSASLTGPRAKRRSLWGLLAMLVVLTAILSATGGSMNPFSAAYLALIVVASLLLELRGVVIIVLSSVLAYGSLFLLPSAQLGHAAHMRGHLLGMWVATALVGTFVAAAILSYRQALEQAQRALRDSEQERARSDQLAALGTLAAGAAHELATPLSTIAVVARELELRLQDPENVEDAALLREEVGRCREILTQMAVRVGATPAELGEQLTVSQLISEAREGLAERPPVQVSVSSEVGALVLTAPRRLLSSVLRSLLRNAQQASSQSQSVELSVTREVGTLYIEVRDHGAGMSPEVLSRAFQPFFTTKEPGEGMGLGLFVADSVARQLGGRLRLESVVGQGTVVALELEGG